MTPDDQAVGVRRWEPSPVNDIVSASYKNNLCLVHRAVLSLFELVWMYLVSLKTIMKIQKNQNRKDQIDAKYFKLYVNIFLL